MDILQGILEEKSRPTTVVRLDKVADKFTAGMVEPLQIQETWSDPLLRYSNLLDGVFHAGVVLCEGDSDCRFYNAVISTALRGTAGSRDLLFTHVGGKARLAKALQQLRRFHVRAAVIADIDVLNDRPILKGLVLASGGSWAEVEADYDTLVAAVESLGITVPSVDATRAEILKQLNGLPGKQAVPDRVADSIKAAVSLGSYIEPFMKSYLKNAEVVSVAPPNTREAELVAQRVDVIITDFPTAVKVTDEFDWAVTIQPKEKLAITPYAYVVPQGDQIWLNYINLFVDTIKLDGRLMKYAKKNKLDPIVAQ